VTSIGDLCSFFSSSIVRRVKMKLVLLLVVAASASPLESVEHSSLVESDGHKTTALDDPGAEREEKMFSVFQIVRFNNDPCMATDGNMGTCYTAAECSAKGGVATGMCASNYGVCCVAVINPNCPVTTQQNNTYIVNPGFPGDLDADQVCTSATGRSEELESRIFFPAAVTTTTTTAAPTPVTFPQTYTYTINKFSSAVVQYRLDFEDFDIGGPTMGDCKDNGTASDYLTITGIDAVTAKTLPDNICGMLTGQHVYLSVKDGSGITITLNIGTGNTQSWKVLVSQYESTETDKLAPRGCLQWFREEAGTISSFNNQGGNGELLNNMMYSVCIEQKDEYCDVSVAATDFSMTKDATSMECSDILTIGSSNYCGDTFANMGNLLWNFTGPYLINVFSDGDNTAMASGFEISYVLLPC